MNIEFTQDVFMNTGLLVASELTGTPINNLAQRELAIVTDRLEAIYTANDPEWKGFLASILFNSPFQQARVRPDTVLKHAELVLKSWVSDEPYSGEGRPCSYFPHLRAQSDAHRGMIPMLTGAGIPNFTPNGQVIPVSGLAMLMAHAMPLGVVRTGSLLFLVDEKVTSNEPHIMREFVRKNIEHNLTRKAGDAFHNTGTGYVTELIRTLWDSQEVGYFLSGCFFSNFGNNADVKIIELNHELASTIFRIRNLKLWRAFAETTWEMRGKTRCNAFFESMYETSERYGNFIDDRMRERVKDFAEANPELARFEDYRKGFEGL